MQKHALIVAGGSGTRMQSELPKQFIPLSGNPILMHTIEAFDFDDIEITLVLPEFQITYWESLCIQHNFSVPHKTVKGGNTRFESVKNGLKAIESNEGLVAIHDGVRPFIQKSTIQSSFEIAQKYGNAIVSVDLKDSLRHVDKSKNKAVDRNQYKIIQTPQTFRIDIIKKAFEVNFQDSFTDDASVLENHGHFIKLIEGDYKNIKITTPEDLLVAESILKQ